MTIRVDSFDFDGCMFNDDFKDSNDIIAANKSLLDSIKNGNQNFTKTITLIGSNRQSFQVDYQNSSRNASCFPEIKKISDYLGSTLDTFLMTDIYGNVPNGTSYELAMKNLAKKDNVSYTDWFYSSTYIDKHNNWLYDKNKTTIIYAQMHKVALENPSEEVIFNFYDDSLDFLASLYAFFSKNPELIPPNLTLNLNRYFDMKLTPQKSLTGNKENIIDANYKQTVKDMAKIAAQKDPAHDGVRSAFDIPRHVCANELLNRIAFAQTSLLDTNTSVIKNDTQKEPQAPISSQLNNQVTLIREPMAVDKPVTQEIEESSRRDKESFKDSNLAAKVDSLLAPLKIKSKLDELIIRLDKLNMTPCLNDLKETAHPDSLEQIALDLSKIYQGSFVTSEVLDKQFNLFYRIEEQAKTGNEFYPLYLITREDPALYKNRYDYIQKAAATGHLMSLAKMVGAILAGYFRPLEISTKWGLESLRYLEEIAIPKLEAEEPNSVILNDIKIELNGVRKARNEILPTIIPRESNAFDELVTKVIDYRRRRGGESSKELTLAPDMIEQLEHSVTTDTVKKGVDLSFAGTFFSTSRALITEEKDKENSLREQCSPN